MRRFTIIVFLSLLAGMFLLVNGSAAADLDSDPILSAMESELQRSMTNLDSVGEAPLYYLAYEVIEERETRLSVNEGGLETPNENVNRYVNVDVRVGSSELDNTHEIRGGSWKDNYTPRRVVNFPLESNPDALRAILWNETDFQLHKAQERYMKVLTNRQVKVEEEDLSADFSPGTVSQFTEDVAYTKVDTAYWDGILKRVGDYVQQYPWVVTSNAMLRATDKTTWFVNSEDTRLKHGNHYLVVAVTVEGIADDGMELERDEMWTAASTAGLPTEDVIMARAVELVEELKELIQAPIVDPYIGPAILRNRASGVFFHEIFGHRIESHRQKSEESGKTFTKKVGEVILPEFISVYDDPTLQTYSGVDLRGYYRFDDEGSPAERVTVVEKGVLRNFLNTRSPIENFPRTNGHARRQFGFEICSRQGNLLIESTNTAPVDTLRTMLIQECKRQGKPYGLVFEDISGGLTMLQRGGPQAFKVVPLLVKRVYADDRPDEVVRGVEIVGTPLTSFNKIMITGNDPTPFNGACGAESGFVPVSAISPSILVSEIEVQKRRKGQEKPPILPPPSSETKEMK